MNTFCLFRVPTESKYERAPKGQLAENYYETSLAPEFQQFRITIFCYGYMQC